MTEYLDTPISWGDEMINHFIPKKYANQVKILQPPEFSRKKMYQGTIEEALEQVLNNPVGYDKSYAELIKEKYQQDKPITFVVDDYTRPNIHTKLVLPIIVEKTLQLGVLESDITILIAVGTHRMPREDEYSKIVGEDFYKKWKEHIISHDCDKDVVMIGTSEAGTPMGFDKLAFESSILVPITDTEFHYFAGQAGTIKEICPGIAARDTVRINHPRMFHRQVGFVPECRLGNTEGNPVISDIKNMVDILRKKITIFGIDTIVTEGEVVYINAGDLISLHETANPKIISMRTVKVPKPADIVISAMQSWGINLYQAGKGVHAAWNAVRQDGKGEIIAVAPLPDGVGNANYEKVMKESENMSIQEALEYVLDNYCTEETFKIGNQKPVDTLRILKTIGEGNLKFVSDMDSEELRKTYRLNPIKKPDESPVEALRREIETYMTANPDAIIYVMDDPGLYVVIE
ncbi:MAG: lactate racemase domain-containing protein [Candidatus Heimdallarchaeaceae archaeon]